MPKWTPKAAEETTRLPATNKHPHNRRPFLKLLERVKPWAPDGSGFVHRKILPCGRRIKISQLPRPAVLLEYAGWRYAEPYKGRGFRHAHMNHHVLWEFDFAAREWVQLAAVSAPDGDPSWALLMMPLADAALNGGRQPKTPTVKAAARRIMTEIDDELDRTPDDLHLAVVTAVEVQLCGKIASFLEVAKDF